MVVHRGKTKIGHIGDKVNLVIDFNDLFYFRGRRNVIHNFTKWMGYITLLASVTLLMISIIIFVQDNGTIALDLFFDIEMQTSELMIGISIFLILYALFLLRDKNKFGERLEVRNLFKLQKYINHHQEIEIENFFTDPVIGIIEQAYKENNSDFLIEISKLTLDNKKIRELLSSKLSINYNDIISLLQANITEPSFDASYKHLFLQLFQNALAMNAEYIDMDVLFYTISKVYWSSILLEKNVTDLQLDALFKWIENEKKLERYRKNWKMLSRLKPTGAINRAYTSRATPTIDQYAIDYTTKIIYGGFELSLGKERELDEIFRVLRKSKDPNVLVTGDPGVGKTHLLKHIASAMVIEDVPSELSDMRLIVLDLNRILSQTSSFNEFETVLNKIINEILGSLNIVVALENIDYVFQIRSEGKLEVLNLLISFIQNSNIKTIATANTDAYFKYIKQNIEFDSLFEVVEIPEASPEIAFQILLEQVPELEKEHKVEILVSAIDRIVKSGFKIQHDKVMPDKGIDLLEEIIVYAASRGLKKIDSNVVDEVFKEKVGVEIGDIHEDERVMLKNLENILHERIIGQDKAVKAVSSALRRARAGLKAKNKPVASFLFYGPTGVGKTLIAKTLADTFFGHENKMIRLNMSEFHEEKNVGRLIGDLDETGNFVGGFLSEQVRNQPYSLVLLDELEKANKKVLDLFLQVLDDGYLTDGSGRDIDFRNTIIIATSNAASKEISELLNDGESYRTIEKHATDLLKQSFRVEFLNRFDKLIMFRSLNINEVEQVTELELDKLNERLSENGYTIEWDVQTVKEIVKIGFSPVFGARQIKRTITEQIEDTISDLIISNEVKKGQSIQFKGLEISNII